jgi:hypothetical protein
MKFTCYVLLSVILAGLTGCEDNLVPLQPGNFANLGYVTVDAQFCTTPPDPSKQNVKYLFILDHSQSNQPDFPLVTGDVTATDPNGDRRYGPLVAFVNSIVPDPNNLTSFSLIDFNDTAYQPAGITGFTTDSATFVQDVTTDWIGSGTAANPVPVDKGFTNYQAALTMAAQIIQADAQEEAALPTEPPVLTSYHIVFVSDGVPTVAQGTGTYTQSFTLDLLPVIHQILDLKNSATVGPFISGIELDTAYYFQTVQLPAAETLLTQIAAAGNGQYFQFGDGADIAYQNFAPPNRNVRHALSDAWVDNQNVVWWDNGNILYDSGGGGMPDQFRVPPGIVGKSDSDGNGVRDLVEYRMKNQVCNDSSCNPAGRDPYAICDGLIPTTQPDGSITYPSTSGSGFNNCESFILGASLNTFSTNGTFLPDFLGFKNALPILAGTDGTQLDPFGDGITNYDKIKQGLPTQVSKSSIQNYLTRVTTLTHRTSTSPDVDCYELVVQNVAVFGNINTIQVSVIENAAVLDDKPTIRYAQHSTAGQGTTLTFQPGDFQ